MEITDNEARHFEGSEDAKGQRFPRIKRRSTSKAYRMAKHRLRGLEKGRRWRERLVGLSPPSLPPLADEWAQGPPYLCDACPRRHTSLPANVFTGHDASKNMITRVNILGIHRPNDDEPRPLAFRLVPFHNEGGRGDGVK